MKKQTSAEKAPKHSDNEIHLFAAANTGGGFVSFFDEAFNRDEIKKIYILKGGPGCGKSTLMKNYGKSAEAKGLTPIYYHCSSDPDSLDGVTVKETGISIIDGTAPHVFDPVYPGVRDFYVDLSQAWDADRLEENKDRIISLARQKSNCYKTAYRLLNAVNTVTDEMYITALSFIDRDKANGFVRRFVHKYIRSRSVRGGLTERIVVNAISSKGLVRLFTPEKAADAIFFIKDAKLVSRFLFQVLSEEAKKSGAAAVFALSPEMPDEVCGIYFPDARICISLYDEGMVKELEAMNKTVKIINASRFIDAERYKACRQKFRFAEKCRETLLDAALSELSAAGAFHSKLEEIYISATDYGKIDSIGKKIP